MPGDNTIIDRAIRPLRAQRYATGRYSTVLAVRSQGERVLFVELLPQDTREVSSHTSKVPLSGQTSEEQYVYHVLVG